MLQKYSFGFCFTASKRISSYVDSFIIIPLAKRILWICWWDVLSNSVAANVYFKGNTKQLLITALQAKNLP